MRLLKECLIVGSEFLHNVIARLHSGPVDVAVVYQHALAAIVFGDDDGGGFHVWIMVFSRSAVPRRAGR